jgi:N utilization substance protein A
LSPAKILNVVLNEETKEAKVGVLENQLSLAIGKAGQNVRLAARLTGWKIDIIEEKLNGEETVAAQPENIVEASETKAVAATEGETVNE